MDKAILECRVGVVSSPNMNLWDLQREIFAYSKQGKAKKIRMDKWESNQDQLQ